MALDTALGVLNTVAIIVGAGSAVVGVNAWKKQLKGSTDYQLARRYLKAVYKLREAISHVRNPLIEAGEFYVAAKKIGLSNGEISDISKSQRAVYSVRWEKVGEAMTDLNVELIEAEVSWGKRASAASEDIRRLADELAVSLNNYLDGSSEWSLKKTIYSLGEDDEFGMRVEDAIKKVEDEMKPHLT